MKVLSTYLIVFIPILCLGQFDIYSVDSLARIQINKYFIEENSEYVLLYEFGCLGCEAEDTCYCEFGDTEIFLISDSGKIAKFNCCESKYGIIYFEASELLNELYTSNQYFVNSFKYDYIESHNDFHRIELIRKDTILSIQIPSFLFNKDYKYKSYNLLQKPKIFADRIEELIMKEDIIKWEKEDNNR